MRPNPLPMSPDQARLLKRLCPKHGVTFNPDWDRDTAKFQISKLIRKDKRDGPPDLAA